MDPGSVTGLGDPYDLLGAAREAADLLEELAPGHADLISSTQSRLEAAIGLAAPLAKRVWTPRELASAWQVSVSTVRGWIDDGELQVFNVGRGSVPHWRIVNAEALRFAELRRKKGRST